MAILHVLLDRRDVVGPDDDAGAETAKAQREKHSLELRLPACRVEHEERHTGERGQ